MGDLLLNRRAILLARVSTGKASQDESPERQLAALRDYCTHHGHRVIGEETERASGSGASRPGLDACMASIRAGRADLLVVTDLDRLGRNLRHMLQIVDELAERRAGLVVMRLGGVAGVTDTTTPHGQLMFAVIGAVGQFVRRLYRERSIEGQAHARAMGKHIGRPLEPVPPPAIVQARTMRAAGASWSAIADRLQAQGVCQPGRTVSGEWREPRRWAPGTLQRACMAQISGEPAVRRRT